MSRSLGDCRVEDLVDFNVCINVLTKRAACKERLGVLNLVGKSPEVEGWASALTVPLLYCFRLRSANEKQARADAQASVQSFRLVPLSEEIISKALASALPDFEDNIQLASAKAISADLSSPGTKGIFARAETH